jgi:ABC-type transport system involved in multi-copper enzyme maturation permease subunit
MKKRRRLPRRLFGPIFGYELIRLARRGQHTRLRAALAAVLLVTLFVLYGNWFPGADLFTLDPTESAARVPREQQARFAESFMHAFLFVQLGVVILLTPVYAAGGIAEEIDRKTLDHLFATDLSDREIVLGKLSARLLYVAGILLTGLPILALAQLWGGIDMMILLKCYGVIGCTMVSLGGLSIWFVVEAGELRAALLRIYLILAAVTVFTFCLTCLAWELSFVSPLHYLYFVLNEQVAASAPFGKPSKFLYSLAVFAAIHLTVGVVGVIAAVMRLRGRKEEPPRIQKEWLHAEWMPPEWRRALVTAAALDPLPLDADGPPMLELQHDADVSPPSPLSKGEEIIDPGPAAAPALGLPALAPQTDADYLAEWASEPAWPVVVKLPPIGNDPLLWKEVNISGPSLWNKSPGMMTCLSSIGLLLGGILFMMLLVAGLENIDAPRRGSGFFTALVRWLGLILLIGWMLSIGLKAASSIARERERQTLDGLLVLPVERREIMRAKWRACWSRGRAVGIGLGLLLLFGTLTGGIHILALPLAGALAASLLMFTVNLGLSLSARCRGTFRASAWLVTVLLIFAGVPLLLGECTEALTRGTFGLRASGAAGQFIASFSPVLAWQTLTFPGAFDVAGVGSELLTLTTFAAALGCTLFALLMAQICWWDARRRFENEGRT